MQSFSTQFTLSRSYLAECFDQSLPHSKNAKPKYWFPVLLFIAGLALLLFSHQPTYIGGMLIAISILELIHIRFRRAWWLARQMWGRSADSEVKLSIDSDGITSKNPYTETSLLWTEVDCVLETELGLILVAKTGAQQYLSKSLFPEPLLSEILAVAKV
ncbi:YcxB family protein [Alginatibacterium sediminis]|uniref:YcxB family protein n=1 Tax=Alginatibacterium sediminis TaxID=2164068 RepID=A0A420E8F6_9ALTE|nr:YcxB family protein [Alginatibacterium sediminis]RKF15695.1 YcxB family protein [Alginatibacterium sediminis]